MSKRFEIIPHSDTSCINGQLKSHTSLFEVCVNMLLTRNNNKIIDSEKIIVLVPGQNYIGSLCSESPLN